MSHRTLCIIFLLMGCHGSSNSSPPAEGSVKPVDVASVIAGCDTAEECERDCASGKPAACVSAGRLYEFGRVVTVDLARAYHFYDQSCIHGYAGGCYNAALLLESGRGTPRDVRRARELYARVCQMGSKTSCARAEALSETGEAAGRP